MMEAAAPVESTGVGGARVAESIELYSLHAAGVRRLVPA